VGQEKKVVFRGPHTPEYHAKHWPLHGGKNPLRPGYYDFNSWLGRRTEEAGRPEIYNTETKKWEYAHSLAVFDKEADRIDKAEAEELAKKHGVVIEAL